MVEKTPYTNDLLEWEEWNIIDLTKVNAKNWKEKSRLCMRLIDVLNNDIVKNENDFSNTRDLIILKNNEEWKTVKEKIKAINVTRVLYEFFEKIDDIYGGHYTLWNTQQSVGDLLDKITKDCNNIPEFIRKT